MSKPSLEGATGGPTPADRREAFIIGAKDCLGMPILVIGSSMVGFGSLARDSGFSWGVHPIYLIPVTDAILDAVVGVNFDAMES